MVLLEVFIVLIKHDLFFDAAFNFKKLNKMNTIILVSIFGRKIFSHTCEDNTILKTLKEALKEGVNLGYVDLANADFRGANLSDANLIGADLKGTNLRCADFRGADLKGTDTTNTRLPIYSKWDFSIENDSLNIGCKTKTFSEWKEWFEKSEEEFSTERNTEDFKRIQAMFYAYEAYYNFLNK